jgi:hypothetical protein
VDEMPCGHTRRIMIGGKCGECTIYPPSRPTHDTTMPPEEWCRAYGVSVLDPDGWRGQDARDWDDPITLLEFERRALLSTADLVNPGWAGVSRDARLCEQDAYAALAAAETDEDRGFHAVVRGRGRGGEDG